MRDVSASVEAVEEVRPVELSASLLDEQLIEWGSIFTGQTFEEIGRAHV